jgi:hypothetical protein
VGYLEGEEGEEARVVLGDGTKGDGTRAVCEAAVACLMSSTITLGESMSSVGGCISTHSTLLYPTPPVPHLMSSTITLGESISSVAIYRGSCLFQLRRRSGVSGVGLSKIMVECSLSLRNNKEEKQRMRQIKRRVNERS